MTLGLLRRSISPSSSNNVIKRMSSSSIPKTMRRLLIEKNGGPEVVQMQDVPVPTPKEGEVLVKVRYAGVNYIDMYFRTGLYPTPLPFPLGQEALSTIVSFGPSSALEKEGFKIGDRVASYSGASYSEYVAVPESKVTKVPEGISDEIAGAVLLQGLTALGQMKESYEVKKGDWVLVHAAAGGVGLNLCAIGKHFGANIIGTVSSEDKVEIAKKAGADHIIVGRPPDSLPKLEEEVKRLTNGEGCHVVYDAIGKDTWESSFNCLRRKGTLVSYGNSSGLAPEFAVGKLTKGNFKVTRPTLANYTFTGEEYRSASKELFDLVEKGVLDVQIHKHYPFSVEGLNQAHADMSGRGTTGKLLIDVGSN